MARPLFTSRTELCTKIPLTCVRGNGRGKTFKVENQNEAESKWQKLPDFSGGRNVVLALNKGSLLCGAFLDSETIMRVGRYNRINLYNYLKQHHKKQSGETTRTREVPRNLATLASHSIGRTCSHLAAAQYNQSLIS